MITIKDCEAFCDADPAWVDELAGNACPSLVQAYARAHGATLSANDGAAVPLLRMAAAETADYRCAA